jgi:hypothetical protein
MSIMTAPIQECPHVSFDSSNLLSKLRHVQRNIISAVGTLSSRGNGYGSGQLFYHD